MVLTRAPGVNECLNLCKMKAEFSAPTSLAKIIKDYIER